jgi:hypothetical protein
LKVEVNDRLSFHTVYIMILLILVQLKQKKCNLQWTDVDHIVKMMVVINLW